MLSLIYNLVRSSVGFISSAQDETSKDELDDAITCIENVYKEKKLEEKCSNRNANYETGTVTFIAADYILINDFYIYKPENTSLDNFKIGDKVNYITLESDDTNECYVKIICTADQSWENDTIEDVQTNVTVQQTLTKCIVGKIINRKNRLIIVEPNNITIDLNKIHSEFVPVIGDWLTLEVEVVVDEDSYTLNEDILEVKKIQPLRSKITVGTISSFDAVKGIGVVGKDTVFNKAICDSGYFPCIGDKVASDSIESDQGIYTWRSLTVVPIFKVTGKPSNLPVLCNTIGMKKDINELVKDKCYIKISDNLNIDLDVEKEKEIKVMIQNTGNMIQVLHKSCFMIQRAQSQLTLIQPANFNTVSIIRPSDTLTYVFKCRAKFIGISQELFVFNFKGFDIGRIFTITVKPKTLKNKPQNEIPKIKHNNLLDIDEWSESTYIPGIRPCKAPSFIKIRSTFYKVPKLYWDLVLQCISEKLAHDQIELKIQEAIPCLESRLTFELYKDRFHALLYLEEIAQTIIMQQYNIESTVMRHYQEFLVMEVPGLVEKRPSLLIGDRAIVSYTWDDSKGKIKYEGFIHKVTNSEIFLKFNQAFHDKYNYEVCQVTFKSSQTAIQRCHNAINMAIHRLGQNFLFPIRVIEKKSQVDLEDIEDTEEKDKPTIEPLSQQRTNSISSESSLDSPTKSGSKITVVERLFNIKHTKENIEIKSDKTERNECIRKNDETHCTQTQNISDTLTQETKNDNLEPYISQVKKRKLRWFNKTLNYYQKEAVRNILRGYARPLPYIIFGPPGTGKTITICETILQIISTMPESRVLIATPSNSSANLIAERLLDTGVLKPGDMVRIIAYHCLNDSIPAKLVPYCATAEIAEEGTVKQTVYNGVGPRLNCPKSVLGRHRITIGTCISLGVLNSIGFPHGHFSHIIVDEAGQATEPEIMIPLNFTHSDYGQVILAGDPLQLGPVVLSRLAKNFGLDQSFLSRLLRQFPYQKDPNGFEAQYDPRLVTKLIYNYRSLPEILELSSSLFYDSELKAQISSTNSDEAKLLEKIADELPERKGSPPAIVFHGVNGENCKDNESPSWYNPEEATQVYLYLLRLYKCGLKPNDIGIITPYQKQVHQIRDLLTELAVELPKISSVEGFQGQERNVIIISVVRSSSSFVNVDIKHSLGFVSCPRRLNVAITRGRALVIIIGNPTLLAQDPYWRSVLMYCINRDSYTGWNFNLSHTSENIDTKANDLFAKTKPKDDIHENW